MVLSEFSKGIQDNKELLSKNDILFTNDKLPPRFQMAPYIPFSIRSRKRYYTGFRFRSDRNQSLDRRKFCANSVLMLDYLSFILCILFSDPFVSKQSEP